MRTKPGASNASPGVTATRDSSSSASRELGRRAEAVGRQHVADVDEQVERAGRLAAAQPRIGGQPRVQLVAALAVLVEHRRDRRLRSGQRRDRRLLRDRRDVRRRVALDRVLTPRSPPPGRSSSRSASRSSRRPSTPSRRCTDRSRQCRASTRGRLCGDRVVDQLLVAEIDDHPDAAPRRFLGDRRRARASEISAPVGLHGELMMMPRVRGVIGVEDRRRRGSRSRPPAMRAHEHRRRVGQLDLLGERRPVRRVRDHFVARAEQRQRRVEQRLLAAGGDDDLATPCTRRRSRCDSGRRSRASGRRCRPTGV